MEAGEEITLLPYNDDMEGGAGNGGGEGEAEGGDNKQSDEHHDEPGALEEGSIGNLLPDSGNKEGSRDSSMLPSGEQADEGILGGGNRNKSDPEEPELPPSASDKRTPEKPLEPEKPREPSVSPQPVPALDRSSSSSSFPLPPPVQPHQPQPSPVQPQPQPIPAQPYQPHSVPQQPQRPGVCRIIATGMDPEMQQYAESLANQAISH